MHRLIVVAAAAVALLGNALGQGRRPAPAPPKPLYVLEDAYLNWRLAPDDQAYSAIDGKHLKTFVAEQTAISRRYRDQGHQFWGRIIGTEADAENARWLADQFRRIGLADIHAQSFDLPPEWMPQSWSVSVSGGGDALELHTAQPTYRSPGTPAEGLDLEAVDVGLASEGDLAGRDLHGKAAVFFSTDYFSRHSTISGGAWKRIADRGAAAIFVIVGVPGNLRMQFYPVGVNVPTFALGMQDGMALRERIGEMRGKDAPRVRIRLNVEMKPDMKTATVWGTLPGTTDENVVIVAHRDGWFEGANDNGTGVATMLGIAEYFAKVPKAQRRHSIVFLGTTGHHDGVASSGRWLLEHPETFAKTALLINCEHTAAEQLVLANGVIRKTNTATAMPWYVGGSPRLEQIVVQAFDSFGVATYSVPERSPAGEIGRYYQFAPALQLIDTGLYWHSDHETDDIIPPTGLAAVTRAYAKIIARIDPLDRKDLERPAAGGSR